MAPSNDGDTTAHDPTSTQRALITGASAGIGKIMAGLFAERGYDLVIVARRRERLEELATQIKDRHGVDVQIIASDLSQPNAARALFDETRRQDWAIDVLVNNAGIGQSGPVAEADLERLTAMLQLNMVALTELVRLYLPDMIARDRGGILNVGSTAGFQPGPGMSAYYATKAYVYSFTEGLVEELRHTNVRVTNLSPGATDTEFQGEADIADTMLFAAGVMTAEQVARAGVDGFEQGKTLVVPGIKNKISAVGAPFMPRAVVRRLVSRINAK